MSGNKPLYQWKDEDLGRLVKKFANDIGNNDEDLMALCTAAATILVGSLYLSNSSDGTFDLKGVTTHKGEQIGDYTVAVTKVSNEPFPDPPKKIEVEESEDAVAGGLRWRDIKRLAYLYAASRIEYFSVRNAPTMWPENKEIFRKVQTLLINDVSKGLLDTAGCKNAAPSFDEAVNMIKEQINKESNDDGTKEV